METALIQGIVGLVMGLVSVIAAAVKTFKFVQEGELGVKLRFGKFVKVVEPGFVLLIPWVETLPRLHVRDRPRDVPPQMITLNDNLTFKVSAFIVFRVSDAYKAMFQVDNIDGAMKLAAACILRELLSDLDYEKASNFSELRESLESKLKDASGDWGVEVKEFAVSDFAPTPETAQVLVAVAEATKLAEGNAILVDSFKELGEKLNAATKEIAAPELLSALLLRGSAQPLVAASGSADGKELRLILSKLGKLEEEIAEL